MDFTVIAHEIWAVSQQLLPDEGIADAVDRIEGVLRDNFEQKESDDEEDAVE